MPPASKRSERKLCRAREGHGRTVRRWDRLLAGSDPDGAVRASIGLFNDEHDVDAFLAAVEIVRRKAWKGTYTERGGQVSGQNAGRCADRWMESAENP